MQSTTMPVNSFLPAVLAQCNNDQLFPSVWNVTTNDDGMWIYANRKNTEPPPRQGWKLHISASVDSASKILAIALKELITEDASFKIIASENHLHRLNTGLYGASQIGKFITVYPHTNAQAIDLVLRLHEATTGFVAPLIPSDRPLRPGSLIHYRYGGFDARHIQTPIGEVHLAIEAPTGELEADSRGTTYTRPTWAVDPFQAAGISDFGSKISLVIAGQYLKTAILHKSPRSTVRMVFDLQAAEVCVLKSAHYTGTRSEPLPLERLEREKEALSFWSDHPLVPKVRRLITDESGAHLVIKYIEGITLEDKVNKYATEGRFLPTENVLEWAYKLAFFLDEMHESSFVYGDLKQSNILITPENDIRLLDFEGVQSNKEHPKSTQTGTIGFISPQRRRGGRVSTADDAYAFGALLYYMVTSIDPSHAPDPHSLTRTKPEYVNRSCPPALSALITRCLSPRTIDRPHLLGPAVEEVTKVSKKAVTVGVRVEETAANTPPMAVAQWLSQIALTIPHGQESIWFAEEGSGTAPSRDFNNGASGLLSALSAAASLSDDESLCSMERIADWLVLSKPFSSGALPGLYVGETGIAISLAQAGIAMNRQDLLDVAKIRMNIISQMPYCSPDLYNGTAGRVRGHLIMHEMTNDAEQLRSAIYAGEQLLRTATIDYDNKARWHIPNGYGPASGRAYLGYAHGAAGIADALLDLFEVTHEPRFAEAAEAAGRWLAGLTVSTLEKKDGADWPVTDSTACPGACWCHGAVGIGAYFLHAAKLSIGPESEMLAFAAARTAARSPWGTDLGQCHGLAGRVEFLFDFCSTVFGASMRYEFENAFRLLADSTLSAMQAHKRGDSRMDYGFMNGMAGIASCFFRTGASQMTPRILGVKVPSVYATSF